MSSHLTKLANQLAYHHYLIPRFQQNLYFALIIHTGIKPGRLRIRTYARKAARKFDVVELHQLAQSILMYTSQELRKEFPQ